MRNLARRLERLERATPPVAEGGGVVLSDEERERRLKALVAAGLLWQDGPQWRGRDVPGIPAGKVARLLCLEG